MESGYNHLACPFFTVIKINSFIFSAIDCFRPFHFNRRFFEGL